MVSLGAAAMIDWFFLMVLCLRAAKKCQSFLWNGSTLWSGHKNSSFLWKGSTPECGLNFSFKNGSTRGAAIIIPVSLKKVLRMDAALIFILKMVLRLGAAIIFRFIKNGFYAWARPFFPIFFLNRSYASGSLIFPAFSNLLVSTYEYGPKI